MPEGLGNSGQARGLLVSVGGTAVPMAYSIEHHRPEKTIFFASSDSPGEIETGVRRLTTHRCQDLSVSWSNSSVSAAVKLELDVGQEKGSIPKEHLLFLRDS